MLNGNGLLKQPFKIEVLEKVSKPTKVNLEFFEAGSNYNHFIYREA